MVKDRVRICAINPRMAAACAILSTCFAPILPM
jgi:hypothetical protein